VVKANRKWDLEADTAKMGYTWNHLELNSGKLLLMALILIRITGNID
jgi:hypothetical protein